MDEYGKVQTALRMRCVENLRRHLLPVAIVLACLSSQGQGLLGGFVNVKASGPWTAETSVAAVCEGCSCVTVRLKSETQAVPAGVRVEFNYPLEDAVGQWRSGAGFGKYITQDWRPEAKWSSSLASQVPLVSFYNSGNTNIVTIACSESRRKVRYVSGVAEGASCLRHEVELFSEPEGPTNRYEVSFLVDTRRTFYADSVRAASDWCEAQLGDGPKASVPSAAYDPLYSFWYSYHQDVTAASVERECAAAADYGFRTVIVDDGWQTADRGGGYAFCGDWRVSPRKFPDFAAHVAKVRAMGLRYMLWYSIPFVGEKSENFPKFKGKYLYHDGGLGASVLDPRFPEVRAFLVSLYERALRDWGLDGLKLDFIDSFRFSGADPAVAEDYAGRDIRSLPHAVDRLMLDIAMRLAAVRPDVLVEFRQSYVGPAMRRYGNMFRVGDCAYGVAQNRVGTIDLRLTSGRIAVHSDMIVWDRKASPETAALQFLNVLFSVPQVSVRLNDLPPGHGEMLRKWLAFWKAHRETLLFGELCPMRPDLNYPIVYAYGKDEQIVAVYDADQVVLIDSSKGRPVVVNATGSDSLVLYRDGVVSRIAIGVSDYLPVEVIAKPRR